MENKIIPFDKKYEFTFTEEKIKIIHPVSNYYLKLDDLSINLLISLKWIRWGYIFFNSIEKELDQIKNDFTLDQIISNSISNLIINKEEKKIILIDNTKILNENHFEEILKKTYTNQIFNENTKIHIKLKLNLREYLIISHMLFPTFIKPNIK